MSAYSIRLFFEDGHPDEQPDGLRHAEVDNWDGYILFVPRPRFSEIMREYPEAKHTGVYILLGEGDNGQKVYIGESDNIGKRINEHFREKKKNWCSSIVLLTRNGDKMNTAHAEYLESLLIKKAKDVGSMKPGDQNSPAGPSLSKSDRLSVEEFAEHVYRVLPSLRIDLFVPQIRTDSISQPIARFTLISKKLGLSAKMRIDQDGKHVVERGSNARRKWKGTRKQNFASKRLRESLVKQGTLALEGEYLVFADDYTINKNKPSTAAAEIVWGGAKSGPRTWKVEGSEKTYGEWKDENESSSN